MKNFRKIHTILVEGVKGKVIEEGNEEENTV